ncbi:HPr family phosphocarrier protein [Dongia rigui]|uniref:Phosphocarrier protein HPr n=1 Tax=Dongia rigui TaxID=940149 RepID=A0ABU5E101_9PROT|nr:HPr family phosphocarrier protein [Dongia rigui]MDY0873235.1 HPr family phosphocarrier protein [Dongia rigui]
MSETAITAAIEITNPTGLHARPAVKMTKLAKSFAAKVQLAFDAAGPWIDAKSVVKVMALKAPKGAVLHFVADGADAAGAVAALVDLVKRDFDENHEDGAADPAAGQVHGGQGHGG